MQKIMRHARELGVTVYFASISDEPTLLGYYLRSRRIIVVRKGLTTAQARWVLAHECGHAFYNHGRSQRTHHSRAAENQADAYAARLLIEPREYARLEAINPDQHWIADELGLSADAVFAFERHCLTRLRGVTYARPRMGDGQWAHRVMV